MSEVQSPKSRVQSQKIKVTFLLLFTFYIFLAVQSTSLAQDFTASVDETTVGDNQRFQVSFTFSGGSINGLSDFKPPSFSNFMVLSGPNQSSSISIINGSQSGSLSYNYIIQPKGIGKFSIGSAGIKQGGNEFKSIPIEITVVKGSAAPQQQKNKNDNTVSYDEIAKNVFIKATVDKSHVYKGEQVTVTYKLYTRLNIAAQMSINKLPQYQGFWAEELETPTNISFTTEVINGKQYRVGLLKRAALFPSQSGELEVTPFELTVPVQVQRQSNKNIWDDFFGDPFGRSETIDFNAKSNIVKIKVDPLPANAPASFNGAVGDFKLETSLNSTTTKTNEPLTLTFTISGSGNFELLGMPEINLPNGFEKYEPKVTSQIYRKGRISGSKKGEYLFVPRVVGTREIPPIEFSYFDPDKKKYMTLKSESYTINIEQGENVISTELTDKEEIQQLGEDIRFIKTSYDDIVKEETYVINSTGFWIAGAAPLLLLSVLVGWKKRSDKLQGNVALLRYQRATKVAKNRLKLANNLMGTQNYKEFYTELSLALFGYLEDKLHIPKSEFTIERAIEILKSDGISEELTIKLKTGAEKCEFIRFAPGAEKSAAMKEMYNEIADVIINIEKNIGEKKYV